MLIEREYEYKPSWRLILLGGAFFGLGTVILAHTALTNDRRLIINGIIELSESNATIFYWVLAFFSLCFVLAVIAITVHKIKFRQRIAFSQTEMIVPASRWSAEEKTIKYADIQSLSVSKISGQKFLNVDYSGGKFIINASMLNSAKVFEDVVDFLSAKVEKQNFS